MQSASMSAVHGMIEFFELVEFILDGFDKQFPSFQDTIRMKHEWQSDQTRWTRFARLSHLKALFGEGWDDHIRIHSKYVKNANAKIEEICSWKLKAVADADAINGDAEKHMSELRDAIKLDIGPMEKNIDESEAQARQLLGGSSLSFSLDMSIPSGDLSEDASDAIVNKLEKRKREITVEISKLQRAIGELGQIKKARHELACFLAARL